MAEWTQPNLEEARARLGSNPEGMPVTDRRRLVSTISGALLCEEPMIGREAVVEVIDLLARDPDWAVRVEVARMVHLLDDQACSRFVAMFRQDCNSYVRNHAERSLARQRKARQSLNRRHSACQSYSDQLDQLARQYGRRAAAKVQALAEQRYVMLAAAVAHDVRSILTTLSANAAALSAELQGEGRIASMVEDIGFIRRTIVMMEQFSKPLPIERHPEDLGQLIRQAIDKAREGLIQQHHDPLPVEVVVPALPRIQIQISRQLVVLALTNLIENALESFADRQEDALRPGRIEVQVVVDGYETRVLVRDNGPGIEAEVLRELGAFVPTGPNKSKRSSSGWGLSLVHKYIAAHGGSVALDSELDKGTTAVITLPMRPAEECDS